MTHVIIAIDGPSASGKGSLARKLAKELGYAYLDTGALYRCVGKAVLDKKGDPADEAVAIAAAKFFIENVRTEDLLDPSLRNDEIGQAASMVGKFGNVRDVLLQFQKDFAHMPQADLKGVILDGRDIGTVICPDADVKLFITASTEERSKRRFKELSSKGITTSYDLVFIDMKQRDERDSSRSAAPLKPADDAHILDTTTMGEAEVLERALDIIKSHAG